MARPPESTSSFLSLSPRIRILPIIHGAGDCAVLVRQELLRGDHDCVAVPLPPSFQEEVEAAVARLPEIAIVAQPDDEPGQEETGYSYVPIDPCQGVIAALRMAAEEHIETAFIDMETTGFVAVTGLFPDPYALKKVHPERFAAALLPAVPSPATAQARTRILWMAHQLRLLERRRKRIFFVCSILDWPWIKDAYTRRLPPPNLEAEFAGRPTAAFTVDPRTLLFALGELPYITGLYERGRRELEPDDNLSVDGVKELVLEARNRLRLTYPRIAARLTPQTLAIYFKYVRNLALIERRLTPDFYTLITAARQVSGDEFALALADTAREYPYQPDQSAGETMGLARMGVNKADLEVWGSGPVVNRLPGRSLTWRTCTLRPRPPRSQQKNWRQRWNPFGMCSWPPEDERIESFHRHVRDQAKQILGLDLAHTEKFTTSFRDGLDVRETLRNWHTGDLYVKVTPPSRGSIEIVVFLFDTPADPALYTNRMTWYAEHDQESTLAFYSTEPLANLVGPGVARAEYGGALFLFPPRPIPDVWTDRSLDFTDTLEERLLAAAFLHSRERHVAVVSPNPPQAAWRRLARRFARKIVHLPLKRFSGQLLERLRVFHVLNGKHVRSYAADFIRDE